MANELKDVTRARVSLHSAALEESEGDCIFRGWIDPSSLMLLKRPTYQREVLSLKQRRHIRDALNAGKRLPDITLALRGENFTCYGTNDVRLDDDVYIIDGFQRVTTAIEYIEDNPNANPRIGAKIHINPTIERELEIFAAQQYQLRLSPNVLLRNARESSFAVLTLYGLSTNERDFPLYNRIQWGQNMARSEIITASVLAKIAMHLFAHLGASRGENAIRVLVPSLDKLVERISIDKFRMNLQVFFAVIDEAWGIRNVYYGSRATWLKSSFLYAVADLFSNHFEFWDPKDPCKLVVPADIRRKLKKFPVNDPTVSPLASTANSNVVRILHGMLRDFVNSGKRTRRLHSRHASPYARDEESGIPRENEDELEEDAA